MELIFRAGRPSDASDLAILFDASSRRTVAWNWSRFSAPGGSWLEAGRNRIRNQPEVVSYHTKWQVAEWDGMVVGAYHAHGVPQLPEDAPLQRADGPLRPLAELERLAQGCWFLLAMTVFAEFRGRGFGRVMLDHACVTGQQAGYKSTAFLLASDNDDGLALYKNSGFTERARRPFVPFVGSEDQGEWLLMMRDL